MDEKNVNNYLLLSVVKNEETNLHKTIKSVVQQSIRPTLWAIFDDCSTDNTPKILAEAEKKYNWILYIRLDNSHQRDLGLHLAKLIKEGFEHLIKYCKIKQIRYKYLANLDGDLILENEFFEKLINELELDPSLGIVSGSTQYLVNNKLITADVDINEPSGGHMLVKKECFEHIDGITVAYSWDSVLKVKARLRGWNTKRVNEAKVFEYRDVNSAEGYWAGYMFRGKGAYYLNLNLMHVIGKGVTYSFKSPYYIGIAYLYGYFLDYFTHKEKINDEELSEYYQNKYKSIINSWDK